MAHPKRKISKTRRDKRRTHYKAPSAHEDEQLQTGVSRDLIRLSIGLENFDDLKNDLENAIKII